MPPTATAEYLLFRHCAGLVCRLYSGFYYYTYIFQNDLEKRGCMEKCIFKSSTSRD